MKTNLNEIRKDLKQKFIQHNIDLVDADYIISYVLNAKKTELIFIKEITKKQARKIYKIARARLKGKPLTKIVKKAYFYGLEFKVNKNVLSPRQDSENLIDTALNYIQENDNVLDLCTGSGCLSIALKKNKKIDVVASDISNKALKVARYNAQKNKAEIKFIKSNMFSKIFVKFDVIISNPPYIETSQVYQLDIEVKKYDPKLALDGGKDGLDFYKIIKENVKNYLKTNGYLILEIGENQKQKIIDLFNNLTFIEAVKDYGDNDRVVVFKNK